MNSNVMWELGYDEFGVDSSSGKTVGSVLGFVGLTIAFVALASAGYTAYEEHKALEKEFEKDYGFK